MKNDFQNETNRETQKQQANRNILRKVIWVLSDKIKPGSVTQSVFSLVTICLGASTITIPYVYYELGLAFGTMAILFGGAICMFTSWMITYCSQQLNVSSYEEIAMASFGKQMQRITSLCMICCNGGFVVSYIVMVS